MPSKDQSTLRDVGKQVEQAMPHERQNDEAEEEKLNSRPEEFFMNPQLHEDDEARDLEQPKIYSFDFYNDFEDDFDDSDLS